MQQMWTISGYLNFLGNFSLLQFSRTLFMKITELIQWENIICINISITCIDKLTVWWRKLPKSAVTKLNNFQLYCGHLGLWGGDCDVSFRQWMGRSSETGKVLCIVLSFKPRIVSLCSFCISWKNFDCSVVQTVHSVCILACTYGSRMQELQWN